MTAFVFANYVDTTLAAAASSTATSLSLSSSANLPTLEPGDVMPLTLNDAATGLVYEIVYVTGISGTTLTVLRAQEGTSAQNWSSGDYAFTGPTAETVAPVAGTHSPVASETLPAANQLVVTPGTLTAGIDLTLNDAAAAGSGVTIYGSAADYAVTVQSPVTTGSPYIELPDGSQVYSWTIPAASPSQGIHADWDGTNWRARTFGQMVVGAATADNEAVNLSQLQQYGGGNFQGFGDYLTSNTTLPDTAWGYAYQIDTSGITITMPTTNGQVGQAIWFYPGFGTGSCTINCTGSGQFIFAPTCGLGSSNTSVTVNAGEWLCIMSRGSGGEMDVVAGSWLNNHQTSQSVEFYAPVAVPAATASGQAPQLSQLFVGNRKAVFTSNGTWPVPDFVSTIWVSGCAAGAGGGSGGGGGSTDYNGSGGGGGGAGQSTIKQAISVTGGHTLSIAIGAGGAGGSATTSTGNSGAGGGNTVLTDSTSSTTLLTLTGGSGGGAGVTTESINPAGPAGGTGYPSGGYGSDGCGTANNTTGTALGGVGASSPFGGGGCPGRAGTGGGENGSSAYGYGGGGGGGGGYYGGGSGSYDGGAGGNGAPGFLVIEW